MVLTLLKANIHLLDGKDCVAIYVINHQIISNDAESQSLEQLSWLYLRNHPDDVLVAPAWNFSFHQHSRRIVNTTRRQFKTGSINLWVCSLKQPGKVYSRTWCFSPVSSWLLPLSSLPSFLTQGFSQEPGKQQWGVFCFPSAASALWFPRDAHTDPTVLHPEFSEPLRAARGILLFSYRFWCRVSTCGAAPSARHRAVLRSSCLTARSPGAARLHSHTSQLVWLLNFRLIQKQKLN